MPKCAYNNKSNHKWCCFNNYPSISDPSTSATWEYIEGGTSIHPLGGKSLCTIFSTPQRCTSGAFPEIKLKTRCDPGSGFYPSSETQRHANGLSILIVIVGRRVPACSKGFLNTLFTGRSLYWQVGNPQSIVDTQCMLFTGWSIYWHVGNSQSIADTQCMLSVPLWKIMNQLSMICWWPHHNNSVKVRLLKVFFVAMKYS